MSTPLAVIAIGGNSLIRDKEHQTVADQYDAVCETAGHIADLVQAGYRVVVTHGNGPQVGFILRRAELAVKEIHMHPVPLVSCGADTQGAIGYQIQQALDNEYRRRGMNAQSVTLVTQVRVDPDDPAFKNPAKPIGTFYSSEEVEAIKKENPDWILIEDAGRGFRRVVPSPKPLEIIELPAIKALLDQNFHLVAVGGGGIPVIEKKGELIGVDAVIDKDYATALLAGNLDADLLIISTGVKEVCLNFGKPDQITLQKITLDEARGYRDAGHFAPGSMLPKVEAAIGFLEAGGKEVIITSPDHLKEAVTAGGGTHILP